MTRLDRDEGLQNPVEVTGGNGLERSVEREVADLVEDETAAEMRVETPLCHRGLDRGGALLRILMSRVDAALHGALLSMVTQALHRSSARESLGTGSDFDGASSGMPMRIVASERRERSRLLRRRAYLVSFVNRSPAEQRAPMLTGPATRNRFVMVCGRPPMRQRNPFKGLARLKSCTKEEA